jgi:hypothetical protein
MLKSAIYIIVIAVIFGFVCGLSPNSDRSQPPSGVMQPVPLLPMPASGGEATGGTVNEVGFRGSLSEMMRFNIDGNIRSELPQQLLASFRSDYVFTEVPTPFGPVRTADLIALVYVTCGFVAVALIWGCVSFYRFLKRACAIAKFTVSI